MHLVKTAGYNHLRLKHGKDTPLKQKVWSWIHQLPEEEEHLPLRKLGQPHTLTAIEEAAFVKYLNILIDQGRGVDNRTLRVCLAACDAVRCNATHEQRNEM